MIVAPAPIAELSPSPQTVLHVMYGFELGGMQRRVADLINHLPDYRHVVLSLSGRFQAASLLTAPAALTVLPDFPRQPLAAVRAAGRVLAGLRPAVLCAYNWGAIEWALAARLSGQAALQIEDGFGPQGPDAAWSRRALTRRLAIGGAVRMVVVSHSLERIAREQWGIPARHLLRIPNGIDLARFQTGAERPCPQLDGAPRDSRLRVGFLGALRPEKRLDRLIAAMIPHLAQAELIIMGGGETEAQLRALTAPYPGQIHLVGPVADPGAWLARLDLFVLASDTEQMPYVLAEAMAAGLPCLATDVGDCAAMLADADQIVAPDQAALATAIGHALADANWRQEKAARNRLRAAEFALSAMLTRWNTLFQSAPNFISGS